MPGVAGEFVVAHLVAPLQIFDAFIEEEKLAHELQVGVDERELPTKHKQNSFRDRRTNIETSFLAAGYLRSARILTLIVTL